MDTITLEPERELRTVWLLIWLIWSVIALLVGAIPLLVLSIMGAPIRGMIPSVIMIAGSLALIIPFGLWIPAYYRSIQYWIQPESVKAKRGVFWKRITTVPYHKITNIDITQGPLQRALGIGTIHIQTAGASGSQGGQAELLIYGVRDLEGIKEIILGSFLRLRTAGIESEKTDSVPDSSAPELMLAELVTIRRLIEDYRK